MQTNITPDEFQDWREHPITRWVFSAIERGVELNRQGWIEASWDKGRCDPLELCELRTRADAYRALIDTDYQTWSDLNEHPEA